MYAVLGAVAAFVLAALVVIGFLGDRMPERQDGKTALGKPLSEQQQTARRRATITAVGAVTAMCGSRTTPSPDALGIKRRGDILQVNPSVVELQKTQAAERFTSRRIASTISSRLMGLG